MRDRLLVPLLWVALACKTTTHETASPDAPTPAKPARPTYARTVTADAVMPEILADAAIIDPDEVVDDLIAITPDDPRLRWRDGGAELLVVTWTSWQGYAEQVGERAPAGREVWVTAAPEVAEFCRAAGLVGDDLVFRLEQYLGLRPHVGKTHFAELWVRPADLLRPCADPEIDDATCRADDHPRPLVLGGHDHVAWFNALKASSYGEGGYPWTRLGYTFDWGAADERGASEFLIPAGREIVVERFVSTAEYCGGAPADGG
ncbi:MAG: hypothetical protein R3B09_35305 [Nannocystaceae bacterium]